MMMYRFGGVVDVSMNCTMWRCRKRVRKESSCLNLVKLCLLFMLFSMYNCLMVMFVFLYLLWNILLNVLWLICWLNFKWSSGIFLKSFCRDDGVVIGFCGGFCGVKGDGVDCGECLFLFLFKVLVSVCMVNGLMYVEVDVGSFWSGVNSSGVVNVFKLKLLGFWWWLGCVFKLSGGVKLNGL